MLDALNFMIPSAAFMQNNHLESTVAGTPPHYCYLKGNWIYQMKSSKGFPWDINYYDSNYIYQVITEQSWTDPKNYKQFLSKSWPNGHGGIVWCPRFITTAPNPLPIYTEDSSYALYQNCIPVTPLGGTPVITHIEGPYYIDQRGDLGKKSTLQQTYIWGKAQDNLELNYYTKGFGWTLWQLWKKTNGLFQLMQESRLNMIMAGGSPVPVFPCTLP